MTNGALLTISGLTKRYPRGGRAVAVLDHVDLTIGRGETLGLVGPSGSGKSTLARAVLRLIEPDSGTIVFDGVDLLTLRGASLRAMRRNLQMVFQDPLAALNPRATVGRVLDDPLRIHAIASSAQRPAAIAALLERVGLPATLAARRIHEISGGQRQRVAIARAIAAGPSLVVLDEALSALDVSIRAGIVDLLRDLQAETTVSYLFITHDLALVRTLAHRVAVMEAGRIVETGDAAAVIAAPSSAMGRALVAAAPRLVRAETGKAPA
jgi:peptide/nickel transport system ATP-binding protein